MFCKVGDRFEHAFEINDAVYEGFMQTFNDRNPLHTNELFAKEKGFPGKVMHGNILNGFLSYFIGECLPENNVMIQSQEIAFHKPFYLHDVVKFEATVTSIHESVNTVSFSFRFVDEQNKLISKGKIQIGILS